MDADNSMMTNFDKFDKFRKDICPIIPLFSLLCSVAMAGLSNYAARMARLSAQIFGEVVHPTDPKSMKVVQLFREPPMAKTKEVYDWYPQHKIYFAMTQKLRFMGLFR